MDIRDIPMFTASEASRLVGLGAWRVRRWLQGYDYKYITGPDAEEHIGHMEPVINRSGDATSYTSFLELIDLLFVKRFLDHGFSLQKIRRALLEAEELLGGKHFARSIFFTDGRKIYVQVKKNDPEALLELLSGGQWVIARIIKKLAHQIDFDQPSGLARRWYPEGPDGMIILDPAISFGRPTLIGRGIATSNIYDLFIAENRKTTRVCSWMNIKPHEVAAAVSFENKLVAA